LKNSSGVENKAKLLEVVYREAHSLKGAARSVNIESRGSLMPVHGKSVFSRKGRQDRSFPGSVRYAAPAAASIDAFLAGDDHPLRIFLKSPRNWDSRGYRPWPALPRRCRGGRTKKNLPQKPVAEP
jgi:hypothetical protein